MSEMIEKQQIVTFTRWNWTMFHISAWKMTETMNLSSQQLFQSALVWTVGLHFLFLQLAVLI